MLTTGLITMDEPKPHTREALINAAVSRFAEHGVEGTSIRRIARDVGVSNPALYRHFSSKDALAAEVFLRFARQYRQIIDTQVRAPLPFVQRLERLVEEVLATRDRNPFGLQLLEERHRSFRLLPKGERTPFDAMTELVESGLRSGELPAQDARLSAALALGALVRLGAFCAAGHLPAQLSPLAAGITRRLIGLLGARTPGPSHRGRDR